MLRPTKESVIVEMPSREKVTPGGIALPDGYKPATDGPRAGRVIALGNATEEIKLGDKVYFVFGYEVEDSDGKLYMSVKEEEIIAIVE